MLSLPRRTADSLPWPPRSAAATAGILIAVVSRPQQKREKGKEKRREKKKKRRVDENDGDDGYHSPMYSLITPLPSAGNASVYCHSWFIPFSYALLRDASLSSSTRPDALRIKSTFSRLSRSFVLSFLFSLFFFSFLVFFLVLIPSFSLCIMYMYIYMYIYYV